MNADYNRDEFGSQIKEAYDKNIPDDYSKKMLLSEIEEKYETEEGRHTIMENMFRVRYICIVSIMFILLIVLPGGTYTAVSMMHDGVNSEDSDSEDSDGKDMDKNSDDTGEDNSESENNNNIREYIARTPEEHKAVLLRILKGDYDDSFVNVSCKGSVLGHKAYDKRLTDALETCDTEMNVVEMSDSQKYTMLGVFGGKGLSDRVFDKNEYRIYAAYAYVFGVNDDPYPTGCTYGLDDKGNVTCYGSENIYSIVINNDAFYCIDDITDYCVNNNENGYIKPGYEYSTFDNNSDINWDNIDTDGRIWDMTSYDSVMYGAPIYIKNYIDDAKEDISGKSGEFNYTTNKKDLKKITKDIKLLSVKDNGEPVYDIPDDLCEKFRKQYPYTISTDNNRYVIADDFGDEENLEYDLGDYYRYGKMFCSLKGLNIEDISGQAGSKTITINVENAYICRKKRVSAEDEKTYQSLGCFGSYVNNFRDYNADDRYTVYLNCGNSITIPFDKQDTLEDYGIYLDDSWLELSEDYLKYGTCGKYNSANIEWYEYYLNYYVKLNVCVNTHYGYEEKTIKIKGIPLSDEMYLGSYAKIDVMYGWETDND